jgi:hypothetical protein
MYYKQVHSNKSPYPVFELLAEKPKWTRPVTFGTKKIDGVKYYRGEKGKLYEVVAFDKFFTPQVRVKVRGKGFKGTNADKTKNWVNNEYSY